MQPLQARREGSPGMRRDDHEHLLGPDYRRDPATGVTGLWRVRIVLEEAT